MLGIIISCPESTVFNELERLSGRPAPFSTLTTKLLWTDPCTSAHMLEYHLDGTVDISSRTTERIDRSVGWLTGAVGIGQGTRVLDLGCGPGLYSNRLAAAGAAVTGVDFSERSIRYAQATAPSSGPGEATYLHGDYLDVPIPGSFDVAMANRGEGHSFTPNPEGGFWSPDPYFEFVSSFVYGAERVTLDRYEIVEARRSRTIDNWLQHYDPPALAAELAGNGFDLAEFLGDLAGTPFDPHGTEFAAVATPRR